MKCYSSLILFFVLLCITSSLSQVPKKISYQGLLTTSSGTPVQNGIYNLKFDLYDSSVTGTLSFTETHENVQVEKGTFSVILGSVSNLDIAFNKKFYIEVTAQAGPELTEPITFFPRAELTSAPYSLAPWASNGNTIYYNSGNVGIGTNNPGPDKLRVEGSTTLAGELLVAGSVDIGGETRIENRLDVWGLLSVMSLNVAGQLNMTQHVSGTISVTSGTPVEIQLCSQSTSEEPSIWLAGAFPTSSATYTTTGACEIVIHNGGTDTYDTYLKISHATSPGTTVTYKYYAMRLR